MVLDGKDGQLPVAQTLHRAVVKVDMGNLQPVVFNALRVNGVTVVLSGDMDSAGSQVTDGMIAAAMTKLQLEGLATKGAGDKLVA